MTEKIIIAGAGGQGIMLLGKVLAMAAMKGARHVTWLPSYGAEVRGGTAHCMVIISDKEISSPYIGKADSLIIMNGPSLRRFKDRISPKGLSVINSSLIDTAVLAHIAQGYPQKHKDSQMAADEKSGCACMQLPRACILPFTDIAIKLGNIKVANMVALGCYLAKKKIINTKTVFEVIEELASYNKRDLIEINKKALSYGAELIK